MSQWLKQQASGFVLKSLSNVEIATVEVMKTLQKAVWDSSSPVSSVFGDLSQIYALDIFQDC